MATREDNLGAALRDYALDQLANADLQLARAGAWQQSGVHAARKAIARLRACVELLHKSPLPARALERRLRTFAHCLSPLRDAQAAFTTAKALRDDDDGPDNDWQELACELKQRRERTLGAALADDPGFAAHRGELAEVRSALTTLAWTRLLASDVQRALKRARKRVQRALDPAISSSGQEPRHRLRRRSRRLLLQIKLLRKLARERMRPRAAAAAHATLHETLGKSLQRKQRKHTIDALGREQDLRVLRRALPPRAANAITRRRVTSLRRELDAAIAGTNERLT
jgi:hypothetical protein